MVKDACILAVLQGWDAQDVVAVTPAPTKAILWEDNFYPALTPTEQPTPTEKPALTTAMTTTTTTNSSWWREAVSHIPRILRHFSTMRPPTTTTTPSPEARRNARWPPANALPFSRRFPANVPINVGPPVDANAASNVDDSSPNVSEDVNRPEDGANSASIISPPSSNVDAERGVVNDDADVDTVPKAIDVVATPLPPNAVATNEEAEVKMEPQPAAVDSSPPSPTAEVDQEPIVKVETAVDSAIISPPAEAEQEPVVKVEPVEVDDSPIISSASSNDFADDNVDNIVASGAIPPPSSNVDIHDADLQQSDGSGSGFSTPIISSSSSNVNYTAEAAVNSTVAPFTTSTSSSTTSSGNAAENVLEVPTTSSSIERVNAIPVGKPSTARTPSLSISTAKTPRSSTSKILDAIRPKVEAEADAESPTTASTITASLDAIVTGW